MNVVHLTGHVSDYGPKISWTEAGKLQTTFTLVVEEGAFRTFIPVLVVGQNAEAAAETLEPGELVALSGKLQWKAGKSKDAGKLVVVCYGVEVLVPAAPQEG
jgi:single-stranded DNA-binding protein